jgi:hypothetical protein
MGIALQRKALTVNAGRPNRLVGKAAIGVECLEPSALYVVVCWILYPLLSATSDTSIWGMSNGLPIGDGGRLACFSEAGGSSAAHVASHPGFAYRASKTDPHYCRL